MRASGCLHTRCAGFGHPCRGLRTPTAGQARTAAIVSGKRCQNLACSTTRPGLFRPLTIMPQSLTGEIDPLAPEPAIRAGALVGYAPVSTKGQLLDRQMHALTEAGRIRADKKSGKNAEREEEELAKALDYLRAGDTLAVPSLDRLGRSIRTSSPSWPAEQIRHA